MNAPGNPVLEKTTPASAIPNVVPADVEADRATIFALWKRNLPANTPNRYRWLYESGRARSWLVRDESRDVIGAVGLMPRRMRLFGEEYPAGQPIDLNVDRNNRLGALALRLQRSVTDEVDHGPLTLLYGLPNEMSEPVLRRAGYTVVGPAQRWARPLRTSEFLEGRVSNRTARKMASMGLDAALWLRSPEWRCRRRREHRFEVTDGYDARFDRLWQRASRQFPIIGCRTSDYLNWRFRDAPAVAHRALCLSDRSDRLLAYVVYTCRDGVAYVTDFLHDDDANANAVFAEFLRMMRVEKARAVVTIFTGAPSVTHRLARFGFRRRPSSWKIVIHAKPAQLNIPRHKLLDANNWFLTRADIDTEF